MTLASSPELFSGPSCMSLKSSDPPFTFSVHYIIFSFFFLLKYHFLNLNLELSLHLFGDVSEDPDDWYLPQKSLNPPGSSPLAPLPACWSFVMSVCEFYFSLFWKLVVWKCGPRAVLFSGLFNSSFLISHFERYGNQMESCCWMEARPRLEKL